jgi:hypothetical protein
MSHQIAISPKVFRFEPTTAVLESALDGLDVRSLVCAMQVSHSWRRAGEADRVWSKFIDDKTKARRWVVQQVGMLIAPWDMSSGQPREAPGNWVAGNFRVAMRNYTLASRVPPEIWHKRLSQLNDEQHGQVPLLAATRPLNDTMCTALIPFRTSDQERIYLRSLAASVLRGDKSSPYWNGAFLPKDQVVVIDFQALGIDVSIPSKPAATKQSEPSGCCNIL